MLIASCIVLGTFNLAVTAGVARCESYQRLQIALQLLIIWLIPVLGASLCWYMLLEDKRLHRTIESSGNEYAESMYNSITHENASHQGSTDGSH
jgi:hypothetical protein